MSNKPKARRTTKRPGRPLGEARKGRKYQIGIRVVGQVKAALARRAEKNGRSLSSEIEHIIERVGEIDRWMETMRTSIAELERTAPEGVLQRQGYTSIPYGWMESGIAKTAKVWFPPGFPFNQFFQWQKAEESK